MSRLPLVQIGWLLAADVWNREILQAHENACQTLQAVLKKQFPQFKWEITFRHRHRVAPRGAIDPLPLLEMGVQEKLLNNWDYALVVVTNELRARERVHTIAIPSSALETAVLSSASLGPIEDLGERLTALALHELGHVWGLEHVESGPMRAPEHPEHLQISEFPTEQREAAIVRLHDVADKRLEEQKRQWRRLPFYWRAFWAEPKGILTDVVGYHPWWLPFQMGRLTAATAVSLVFLLLAAESWEAGVNATLTVLTAGTLTAVVVATLFIFRGQNLGQISREVGWREQLARTYIVTFATLLAGMFALWFVLFLGSYAAGLLMPDRVLLGWTGREAVTHDMLLRQAAFMAIIGVLAGALGGNLEDEDDLKAKLFYDEET